MTVLLSVCLYILFVCLLFVGVLLQAAPPDIRVALTEIVSFMIDRDYIQVKHCPCSIFIIKLSSKLMVCVCLLQSHEAYLRMAIGNAPWPLGVTMVGIHARTGREKIFAQNVARILHMHVAVTIRLLSVSLSET